MQRLFETDEGFLELRFGNMRFRQPGQRFESYRWIPIDGDCQRSSKAALRVIPRLRLHL